MAFVLEKSFIDFLLGYRLYVLIVTFSYFYYYSIQYDLDKEKQLIRNVVIYGNLYLFAHIFFRPLLNISHELFVLLWLIILLIWWSTKLKSRWKYLIQIIGWISSFFILVSWIFYLYPDKPDVNGFVKSRQSQISILWVTKSITRDDAYIQIVDSKKTNIFDIDFYFKRPIAENCIISYPSSKNQRDENLVITTVYWDIIWVFPQSELQLEFDDQGSLVKVSKLDWKIWFLSWVFKSPLDVVWDIENLSQVQQDWIEWVQYQYKYDLVYYLKNQISDNDMSFVNSIVMYKIDGKIIKLLARMFPMIFIKNLDNYNEFQKYFDWVYENPSVWLGKYSAEQRKWLSISDFWKHIKWGVGAWKWNVYDVFKKH